MYPQNLLEHFTTNESYYNNKMTYLPINNIVINHTVPIYVYTYKDFIMETLNVYL